jgi:hypothetical protein
MSKGINMNTGGGFRLSELADVVIASIAAGRIGVGRVCRERKPSFWILFKISVIPYLVIDVRVR